MQLTEVILVQVVCSADRLLDLFSVIPCWIFAFAVVSLALPYSGLSVSSNRVTKEVDATSKEAKSFLKQQEKRQSSGPASLPTVSG